MSVWAVLLGALAAGVLAWSAIAGFAWTGDGHLNTRPIRLFGAAALAGLPVPWPVAPGLLAVGLVAGLVERVWRSEEA